MQFCNPHLLIIDEQKHINYFVSLQRKQTLMYLDSYKKQIILLCEKNNVKHLFAFGSVLTNRFSDESDIDLLVDIKSQDPIIYAEQYFELKFKLEDLLCRKIDLLEEKALKNKYLMENINNSKQLIYGA